MKNILMFGPPRSGKTTLSKMIVKEIPCYSVINTDVVRDGIYEAFFKSVDKKERKDIVKKAFPKFVSKILEDYKKFYNPDLYYVIEGDAISIEESLKIFNSQEIEIICVGNPNIKPKDLFKRIRTNALKYGCWTEKYSDEELLGRCKEFIKQSQKEEKIAKENNLIYLDTSSNMNCLLECVERLKS